MAQHLGVSNNAASVSLATLLRGKRARRVGYGKYSGKGKVIKHG
jgi:hypothetical protein